MWGECFAESDRAVGEHTCIGESIPPRPGDFMADQKGHRRERNEASKVQLWRKPLLQAMTLVWLRGLVLYIRQASNAPIARLMTSLAGVIVCFMVNTMGIIRVCVDLNGVLHACPRRHPPSGFQETNNNLATCRCRREMSLNREGVLAADGRCLLCKDPRSTGGQRLDHDNAAEGLALRAAVKKKTGFLIHFPNSAWRECVDFGGYGRRGARGRDIGHPKPVEAPLKCR